MGERFMVRGSGFTGRDGATDSHRFAWMRMVGLVDPDEDVGAGG
jgi:hypothetical protein